MTTTQRRLYMLFFVVLFLLTAPVIILFAQGYRFDRVGNIFVHSGSLTIKSWPREVDIYVDGKLREKSNLNVINNSYTVNGIRPGKHSIVCKKDGHTSWEKEIEVHSGISTEFWNVILFPIANREIKTYNFASIDQFFISPRSKSEVVFFWHDNHRRYVSLLNTQDNSSEIIFETEEFDFIEPSEEENVEWSSDNKRILIPFEKQGEKIFIIARIKKENLQDIINLNELFFTSNIAESGVLKKPDPDSKNFHKVRWMFDKNDELVIMTKDHILHYFDITKPKQKIEIDERVSGFDFAGNRIYYSQLPNNIIWEIKNNDINTRKQITNVAVPGENHNFLKLTAYDQYRIAIETEDKRLYVYNEEKEKSEKSMYDLGTSIMGVQFSDDGKKIAYWTSTEIWCLMLRDWKVQPIREKGDKIFITRFSRPISNIQWMDDYENLIFTVENWVKSINIDTRWGVQSADILYIHESPFENRFVLYNKDNQNLYFTSKSQDGKNLLNTTTLINKGFFDF